LLAQSLQCPECGSNRLWKAGLRYTTCGEVQRYVCRDCGIRFTDPEFTGKNHISENEQTVSRQICVLDEKAKNLVAVETKEKQTAGETTTKGHLVNYEAKLIFKGLKPKTIINRINSLKLLKKRGADILNPESVFHTIDIAKKYNHKDKIITEESWSDGTKNNTAQVYKSFCQILNIQIPEHINFEKWSKRFSKLPYLPQTKEIETLIGGCSKKVATFLQLIKETGCRCGEAWRLTWTDFNDQTGILTINKPEKMVYQDNSNSQENLYLC
jgi:integrase/predicted RNA-binding Zn-ribbon protein involved in translation (DUF1610 family)